MSLGFSYYMLAWHHSFQIGRTTNIDKRAQGHLAIVITTQPLCKHCSTASHSTHSNGVVSLYSSLLDPPPPINFRRSSLLN